jgi:hypothetical protein
MRHPDLHDLAFDRISAGGVTKLGLHKAPSPGTHAPVCASRRSTALRRVPFDPPLSRATTAAPRAAGRSPEDAALYLCHCGSRFMAAVTTCVTCPSCGTRQAW